jgi:hypothetical protein
MNSKLVVLRDELEEELANISGLLQSLRDALSQELDPGIEKRVAASMLTDFYLAGERIFKRIGKEIDQTLPEGDDWHKQLLRQMSVDLPKIRPRVIDKELYLMLGEYLKFRHIVRNIYGFQLEYGRFAHLVEKSENVATQLEMQVREFLQGMENIAEEMK